MAREDQAVLNEANMKKNFDALSGKPQQKKVEKKKNLTTTSRIDRNLPKYLMDLGRLAGVVLIPRVLGLAIDLHWMGKEITPIYIRNVARLGRSKCDLWKFHILEKIIILYAVQRRQMVRAKSSARGLYLVSQLY